MKISNAVLGGLDFLAQDWIGGPDQDAVPMSGNQMENVPAVTRNMLTAPSILGLLDSARSVALKDGLDPHLVEEAALYWSVSHAYHSDPDDLVSKLVHVVGAVTQAERRRSSDA